MRKTKVSFEEDVINKTAQQVMPVLSTIGSVTFDDDFNVIDQPCYDDEDENIQAEEHDIEKEEKDKSPDRDGENNKDDEVYLDTKTSPRVDGESPQKLTSKRLKQFKENEKLK